MSDKDLIVIEGEQYLGQPINRDLVVEFGDTLMGVHPNAREIGLQGMRTVAQLALVTGANPLPGTNGIHAWKDKRGNICVTFGIGYWRTQAELEGGVLWIDRPRPMTESEREYYGILDTQIASICSGALKRDAFSLMQDSRKMGYEMDLREAKSEVGRTGTAIVNKSEYAKNGRSLQWTADKRAETDMLSQLVPAMARAFQNAKEGVTVTGGLDWTAGEYTHLQSEYDHVPEDYSADDANADLFDDEPADIVDVDTDTGEIVEHLEEPEDEPESDSGPRVTKLMLRELHALGTFIYKKGWDAERARRSKEFGVESSKDWTVKQYYSVFDPLKEMKKRQIEKEDAEAQPLFEG